MKATGRPGRKAASHKGAPSRMADASALGEERVLVEAAKSDPAKFDALYELHFEPAAVKDRFGNTWYLNTFRGK